MTNMVLNKNQHNFSTPSHKVCNFDKYSNLSVISKTKLHKTFKQSIDIIVKDINHSQNLLKMIIFV